MNLQLAHPEKTGAHPLLERQDEIRRGAAVVDDALKGHGGVLSIEGPAGIGKTSLLADLCRRADDSGMRVLSATGSELEREFAFGVVRQLYEPMVAPACPEAREMMFDGAAHTAETALGIAPSSSPARGDERYAVVHGLYWLTANMAADRPLVIAVDDLQWADEPSQRFLAYLARRVPGMSVAVMTAFRPLVTDDAQPALNAMVAASGGVPMLLGPLGEDSIRWLAFAELGSEPDAAFVRACHAATGGNALLIEELLADLSERGAAPDAATAGGIERMGSERISRRIRRRIEGLPDGGCHLAAVVAVLGDGCALETAAALAELDLDTCARAAAALTAADILAEGPTLRFRHPLVRAAVVDHLPAVQRAAGHGRAAKLLADRGAPAAAIATHLLMAPPAGDPRAAEILRAAARAARDQGVPEQAVNLLRRALEEPPPAEARGAVLGELGEAAVASGQPEATDYLAAAMECIDDQRERAALAVDLVSAFAERGRWSDSVDVGRRALADLGDRDRELRLTLIAQVADGLRMDLTAAGGDEIERVRALAEELDGDTPGERLVLASVALMKPLQTAAEHEHAAELMARSFADGGRRQWVGETGIVSNYIRTSRLDLAESLIEERLGDARAGGYVRLHTNMQFFRGWVNYERGNLGEAEADLELAIEAGTELDASVHPGCALLALVYAEQGRFDDADALMYRLGLEGDLPHQQVMSLVTMWRGRVRQLQRRADAALEDLLETGNRYDRFDIRRAVPPWRSYAAVLLAARGDTERALELAREEVELAELWGTPLVKGIARRGLGLVTDDVAELERAVDLLAESPARLELARGRYELGAALRRSGRRAESRDPLKLAMDEAYDCGAVALAERARDELRASGARPRRLALSGAESLTASERRVAQLAADGMTNRQIAQELFVTTATVETHLRHAFQKLEVGGRDQLGSALAA